MVDNQLHYGSYVATLAIGSESKEVVMQIDPLTDITWLQAMNRNDRYHPSRSASAVRQLHSIGFRDIDQRLISGNIYLEDLHAMGGVRGLVVVEDGGTQKSYIYGKFDGVLALSPSNTFFHKWAASEKYLLYLHQDTMKGSLEVKEEIDIRDSCRQFSTQAPSIVNLAIPDNGRWNWKATLSHINASYGGFHQKITPSRKFRDIDFDMTRKFSKCLVIFTKSL